MKIAVACEGSQITEHFGHCQNFMIFDIKDNNIIDIKSLSNPGHKPGFLPNYLNELGINIIISGGMGGGAIDIFNNLKIAVITGAKGDANTAVAQYLRGNLKSTNSTCHEHKHKDTCGH